MSDKKKTKRPTGKDPLAKVKAVAPGSCTS